MFKLISRRPKTFISLGAIAGMIVVAGAIAYFTATSGSGSGNATVGNATQWAVSTGSGTGGPIYPGAGSEKIPFTITNNGGGYQNLATVSYAIASDTTGTNCPGVSCSNPNYGDVQTTAGDTNTDVAGCLASWFNAAASTNPANPSLPDDIPPSGVGTNTYSGNVDVTMSNQSTSQDACKNATPAVTVTASS